MYTVPRARAYFGLMQKLRSSSICGTGAQACCTCPAVVESYAARGVQIKLQPLPIFQPAVAVVGWLLQRNAVVLRWLHSLIQLVGG